MPNEFDRSLHVLELSLSCSLRELAQTLLGMDTEEERRRNAFLAVGLIAHRFTAFTDAEIMWYLNEHIRRIEYNKLEQDLINYSEAATTTMKVMDNNIHVLTTELAQARKDAAYWRQQVEQCCGTEQVLRTLPVRRKK